MDSQTWQNLGIVSGYTGTAYLQALPDIGAIYTPTQTKASASYPIQFNNPGIYKLWLRGYAHNAAGDSVYLSLNNDLLTVTGFAPNAWAWLEATEQITIPASGLYTLTLGMREDGLRVDRILLTTDTNYIPSLFGPAETLRAVNNDQLVMINERVIDYSYDQLYRLTQADYTSGENYQYAYDSVGNRLEQIINGDATSYTYDPANRLQQVSSQFSVSSFQYDDNGNLLSSGTMTNTWDAANRLIATQRANSATITELVPIYDGLGNRVTQTKGASTTHFALDSSMGLPEVIASRSVTNTSEGNAYLHLPGLMMTQNPNGNTRYLLSDGLGSVRHIVDETANLVSYREYDPYGNPLAPPFQRSNAQSFFAFTGEWWEDEVSLLYLRARWYAPETGTFLSVDPVESEPEYQYVRGNPSNLVDPSGMTSSANSCNCRAFTTSGWSRGSSLAMSLGLHTLIPGEVYQERVPPFPWGSEIVY